MSCMYTLTYIQSPYVFILIKALGETPSLRDVRLVDGTGNFSGRLEIYYFHPDTFSSVWGTVCGTGFDYRVGDLVCQQLGFQSAYRVGTVRELGYGCMRTHLHRKYSGTPH